MKKITFLICLIATTLIQAQSTKQIFESPNLKEAISSHKTVAVLPFKSTISYKRLPKNFNPETNAQEEKKSALSLQSGLYTYLLRKSSDYSVTVQDPERTNVLLKQSGNFDKIDDLTPDALAKILGVDAVIKCTYAYQKTGSEGGAIVKSLLIGFGTGKVATSDLTMNIYNAKDGDLLWRFYKQMDEDVMSNPQAMMEHMMRKVGRNFPYEKS
ncbi:hypothetical protein SAMN05192550_0384 [Flavobacterium glycines]|jgi:hypothetical protein|uniref:DUF4410 domain-containing protein n=1 Tax=Flavobacterium glycines TaxID=551990 RepID=A0A1B9DPE7_9FLAO|nr:hypothetical protein [Flavobacterium glycines]OCB71545.1 hypothetical protein FBGL_09920 [Flavobacterium glycines]GEL10575.1 hypothetical protein FGL01_13140 [Flavobacterium glycines]SDI62717.1 hypothetical protein SAMN05192550_0384 [Flavobacterium glycines]